MTLPDMIALGIIFFLLFCAVRYIAVSRKKGGCGGRCSHCRGCGETDSKQPVNSPTRKELKK